MCSCSGDLLALKHIPRRHGKHAKPSQNCSRGCCPSCLFAFGGTDKLQEVPAVALQCAHACMSSTFGQTAAGRCCCWVVAAVVSRECLCAGSSAVPCCCVLRGVLTHGESQSGEGLSPTASFHTVGYRGRTRFYQLHAGSTCTVTPVLLTQVVRRCQQRMHTMAESTAACWKCRLLKALRCGAGACWLLYP